MARMLREAGEPHPGQGLLNAVMLALEDVTAGTPRGTAPHSPVLPAPNTSCSMIDQLYVSFDAHMLA